MLKNALGCRSEVAYSAHYLWIPFVAMIAVLEISIDLFILPIRLKENQLEMTKK